MRACVALALASGVAPSIWAEEGIRAIATAQELLERARKGSGRDDEDDELTEG